MNKSRPMPHGKPKMDMGVLKRLIGMLFHFYPVLLPISIACIVFSAIASAIPAVFLEQVTTAIDQCLKNGTPWDEAQKLIVPKVLLLVSFYVLSIIAVTLETQMMAKITQGFLGKMRKKLLLKHY